MNNDEQLIFIIERLVASPPMSSSDAVDWINEARQILETSADIIEHLAHKRDELDEACEALALLNTILIDKADIEHEPRCDRDARKWIEVNRFTCKGCELEALIRFVSDYEQLPEWPNSQYLIAAHNAHLLNPN
jgi:hypothetical protein